MSANTRFHAGKAAKENGLFMSTSRVSGSGEVCGRAPLAIIGAARRSVSRTASGMSSRSNRAMKVTGRPLSVEQEVQQLALVLLEHADLAGQRDLDGALAALLQLVGVGLQLLAAGVAAGQRLALEAHMLVERGRGEAERAGIDGLADQARRSSPSPPGVAARSIEASPMT